MKRWALIVAGLYVALLLVMTVPAILLALAPHVGVGEAFKAFAAWPYWVWLVIMLVSQIALLAVPV
ncbi:MAG TPA: hypothetical protein VF480_06065, partial [Verrucomicrobiae bacterium]